jgi:hypothetical protein
MERKNPKITHFIAIAVSSLGTMPSQISPRTLHKRASFEMHLRRRFCKGLAKYSACRRLPEQRT